MATPKIIQRKQKLDYALIFPYFKVIFNRDRPVICAWQSLLAWMTGASRQGLLVAGALLLQLPGTGHAAPVVSADPFVGVVWHAVKKSWPGTITFNATGRKVVLQPLGSDPINATYAYTIKPQLGSTGSPKLKKMAVIDGTLTMTNTKGQVSKADFHLAGKELELTYQGSVQIESYTAMTPLEEKAELERIKKLSANGKFLTP